MASRYFLTASLRLWEIKVQVLSCWEPFAKIIASENPITEFMLAAAPIITKIRTRTYMCIPALPLPNKNFQDCKP